MALFTKTWLEHSFFFLIYPLHLSWCNVVGVGCCRQRATTDVTAFSLSESPCLSIRDHCWTIRFHQKMPRSLHFFIIVADNISHHRRISNVKLFHFISGTNICGANNGGCSHICLTVGSKKFKCLCPDGGSLNNDDKTCEFN